MTPSTPTRNSESAIEPLGYLARFATALIRGYQLYISPLFGPHCRYYPSCSEYARQAFIMHGPLKGARLAIGRILRCNPFSYGGVDHVPSPTCCADGHPPHRSSSSSPINEHNNGS